MKDKIKEIIEKHEVLHENGTYWDEKLLNNNIAKMYQYLFALYDVSQQRELLMRDSLVKSREENARIRESIAIKKTLEIYCDLEELPTVEEVLERIGRKH